MKKRDKNMRRNAFTLLEIMIAVTIFVLVSSALYTTFRVGMRAYSSGEREINMMQHSRVIFDIMSRDFRSVYYLPESSYNRTMQYMITRFEQERNKAEMEGRLDEFLYGRENDSNDNGARNPYEYGIEVNLSFKAENHGDEDSISFVRYQMDDGITGTQPWALGRVGYKVEDERLIRTEEDIIEPTKDLEGNVIEEKIPRTDVLAKGVKRFDLYFGFFYDDDWMEADDWDSSAKRYRNPTEELDEDDPDYQEKLRREQRKPVDGLPAYIRVSLEIAEEKKSESQKEKSPETKKVRTKSFSTLIRIPTALENYIPSLEEKEDEE